MFCLAFSTFPLKLNAPNLVALTLLTRTMSTVTHFPSLMGNVRCCRLQMFLLMSIVPAFKMVNLYKHGH